MKTLITFSVVFALAYGVYVPLPPPFTDFCVLDNNINLYKPKELNAAPWETLDLDLPYDQRWQKIGNKYASNIKSLIGNLTNWLLPLFNNLGFPSVYNLTMDAMVNHVLPRIPDPYQSEIRGMATATGLDLGEIVLYNIFYEIFTVCTSVVANDDNGHIYHARNLDFGLLLGWDNKTHEWAVTENLRTMIFNLNWTRNGTSVFKSVQFGGYVGVLSGMKEGAFTVTVDDRFVAEGGIVGLLRWFFTNETLSFTTWLTREMFENNTVASYQDAVVHLNSTKIMAPVYYIVGGAYPWEGTILARSIETTNITTAFDPNAANGWYVLETNYDQGTDVLYLDDRRTPGHYCMEKLGQSNVNFQGLFNVMNSKTTLNMLTTYTVLMSAQTGEFETYIVNCSHPCYPW